MGSPKKITLSSFLPCCFFNPKGSKPKPDQKRVVPSSSPQRLSISDLSNPGSELSISGLSSSLIGSNLHVFTLDELRLITNSFSYSGNFIGEGGFGAVYKGFIHDTLRAGLRAQNVAVKVLDLEGSQGHREWLVIFFDQLN